VRAIQKVRMGLRPMAATMIHRTQVGRSEDHPPRRLSAARTKTIPVTKWLMKDEHWIASLTRTTPRSARTLAEVARPSCLEGERYTRNLRKKEQPGRQHQRAD
jgi:hypothetical protein